MLWQQNRDLALFLHNQGLADCLAARFALARGPEALLGSRLRSPI